MSANLGIEARGVAKTFGGGAEAVRALQRVSVQVRDNEFFTLLAPSGCGKTRLLHLIAGFEQLSEGEFLLDGAPVSHLPPHRCPVNTVFQSYALFPHMSVADNVAFGLEIQGYSASKTAAPVEEMPALVKLSGFDQPTLFVMAGGDAVAEIGVNAVNVLSGFEGGS